MLEFFSAFERAPVQIGKCLYCSLVETILNDPCFREVFLFPLEGHTQDLTFCDNRLQKNSCSVLYSQAMYRVLLSVSLNTKRLQ